MKILNEVVPQCQVMNKKKDKHHQRKISFTALVFLYYIIVIKAPT